MNIAIVLGIMTATFSVIFGSMAIIRPAIGNALVTSVFTVGIILLYYDLRVRKESRPFLQKGLLSSVL